MIRAYHFVGDTLRDGRPVPLDGEWLVHEGPAVMCESGLHASRHPYDALRYAPGNVLCHGDCDEVECPICNHISDVMRWRVKNVSSRKHNRRRNTRQRAGLGIG